MNDVVAAARLKWNDSQIKHEMWKYSKGVAFISGHFNDHHHHPPPPPAMSHSFMALSQHDSQTASRPALMAVEHYRV